MRVLANDFKKQWEDVREKAITSFDNFGESGWYILGDAVKKFEIDLAKFWGENFFASGCASGLDAIELSLRTLEIKKDELVLTTPLSAFATTLAIIRAGGIPVFIDTDKNGLIDLKLAQDFFDKNPQCRFFVPVHLYGHALNLDVLDALRKKGVLIVEDCAQAIGAQYKKRAVGSSSEICTTSFYPTKNLGAFGDGGAVLSQNETYIKKFSCLRNYGQTHKYHHEFLGSNSRLDELQASLMGECLLPTLEKNIQKRRKIAKQYKQDIQNSQIELIEEPKNSYSTYHLFPIVVPDQKEFMKYLSDNGIEGNIHYPSLITDQPAMVGVPYVVFGSLERAHFLSQHVVSLPIHPYMEEDQISYVTEICNKWRS
jgi:dTDP-3-amino-3,4,6-trideoxy-alpha-D-glucose transaminase